MKPANDTMHHHSWKRRVAIAGLVIAVAWSSSGSINAWAQPLEGQPGVKRNADEKPTLTWEVRCLDDSTIRLMLLDEQIELGTPFGKLLIPAVEIRRIDFAWRNPEEIAKRIEAAVADLGHADFKRREEASLQLTEIGERAHPALLEAAKHKDLEVSRRAEDLLQKLRDELPAERLELRPFDVIHTEHSKIAGRIAASALKVKTSQFGEQQLKLTDIRTLRAPTGVEVDPANVLPDPGSLSRQEFPIGKLLVFRVTGAQPGGHGVWGTGIYTVDSNLSAAAVHAGALRPGQTGLVRVTLVGPVAQFVGSLQNGVTSSGWGGMPGYRIER
jgi:hypothetical protein